MTATPRARGALALLLLAVLVRSGGAQRFTTAESTCVCTDSTNTNCEPAIRFLPGNGTNEYLLLLEVDETALNVTYDELGFQAPATNVTINDAWLANTTNCNFDDGADGFVMCVNWPSLDSWSCVNGTWTNATDTAPAAPPQDDAPPPAEDEELSPEDGGVEDGDPADGEDGDPADGEDGDPADGEDGDPADGEDDEKTPDDELEPEYEYEAYYSDQADSTASSSASSDYGGSTDFSYEYAPPSDDEYSADYSFSSDDFDWPEDSSESLLEDLSKVTNLGQASTALTNELKNVTDPDALLARQSSLLTSLSGGLGNSSANVSSASAAKSAALLDAILNVNPDLELTGQVQDNALALLTRVASADVNSKTVTNAISSLSAVADSAKNNKPENLEKVTDVVVSLLASQAASLATRLANITNSSVVLPAINTKSELISTLVQVDAPGSGRLATKGFGAANGTSSFQPLPTSVLGDIKGSVVVTNFVTLAYDPYAAAAAANATKNGTNTTNSTGGATRSAPIRRFKLKSQRAAAAAAAGTPLPAYATTGVTRLALTNPNGTAIPVENAGSPIRFVLPAVNTSSGAKAVCQYWDVTKKAYSDEGCGMVPSPSPRNHTLRMLNLTTPNDAVLPLLWNITGPLASNLCAVRLVDCTAATSQAYELFETGGTSGRRPPRYLPSDAELCAGFNFTGAGAKAPSALAKPLADALRADIGGLGVYDAEITTTINGSTITACILVHRGDHYMRALASLQRPLATSIMALAPTVNSTMPRARVIVFPKDAIVYMDRAWPFRLPSVSCPAGGKKQTLRVFYGPGCALYDPNNNASCYWSNEKQVFVGDACTITMSRGTGGTGNATQCACRHLTDFASARAPKIATCSLSDLASIDPALIVTKLKLLLIVIVVLFSVMVIGALAGFLMDSRDRRNYLAQLKLPETGFRDVGGAWIWRFRLSALDDELDVPTGPAVALSSMLGLPLPRLRAALPDDMISWGLPTSLGRKHAFSTSKITEHHEQHTAMMPSLVGGTTGKIQRDIVEDDDKDDYAHMTEAEAATMDDFVGTALVLAFIQVATLMPVAQLAERRSAAKRHFAGVTTPAGRDFTKTCTDFVTLVSPGILNGTRRWLPTARLWRLILSQNVEGYWDASTTTAFALEARAQAETDTLPKLSFAVRLTTSLSVYATEGAKEATLFFAETARNELRVSSDKKRAELIAAEEVTGSDCPLTCHRHSIIETMPKALAEVHDADSEVDVARVWTTLLCIKMLEGYAYNFISGDGDLYPETERTIVDAGREWLEAQAQAHPALGAALQDGSIRRAAGSVTRLWARATEQRVMELRRCEGIRKQMNYSHVHRTMTSLTRAFALQHTTMSTFLAQPLDGIQRWQKFVILVTLVISQLLVNIWMFYSKAVNCCADVRAVIDADTGNCPPVGACRGTAENANCGDLTKQFETVPVLPDYPHGLKDYKCTAWPDDDRPLDTFVVGLISIAVALPVSLFMFSCFAMANDSEAPESWLNWSSPVMKLFFGLNANRRWNYTAGAQPTRYVKWYVRSVDAPKPETMINLCHSLWAFVLRRDTPWIKEWKEVEAEKKMAAEAVEAAPEAAADKAPSEGSSMRSAHALGAYKRMLMTSGIVSGIICWAIFTWFVFTYGMLIYRLLGDGAQDSFARSWGISYGLNAATEWRDIMIEAAKGAIILAILERLFLTRPLYWLEEHMDYLSLQALILKQTSLNFWGQIRVFYAHTKRVS